MSVRSLLEMPIGVEVPRAAADPALPRIAEVLEAARRLPHGGGSFAEHLTGTWRILALWDQPEFMCRAGLMHSVYATVFYPHALYTLDQRDTVRALVGERAERLIHWFSVLDRRRLWKISDAIPEDGLDVDEFGSERSHHLTASEIAELLVLEMANLADQGAWSSDGSEASWMHACGRWARFAGKYQRVPDLARGLDAASESRAKSAYREGRARAAIGGSDARGFFVEAARLNPWAAEPHVWLSADTTASEASRRLHAKEARRLLLAWGTAWDKQLPWAAWLDLCEAEEGDHGPNLRLAQEEEKRGEHQPLKSLHAEEREDSELKHDP